MNELWVAVVYNGDKMEVYGPYDNQRMADQYLSRMRREDDADKYRINYNKYRVRRLVFDRESRPITRFNDV